MEHNQVSAMMKGWYAMWGTELNVRPYATYVVDQTGVSGGYQGQNQTMEGKEEEQGKSYYEASSSVQEPTHPEQTSSLEQVQRYDSNGQDLTKQDAQ